MMNERCLNLSHSESCRCGAGHVRCGFCLENGHDKAQCPRLKPLDTLREFGIVDPMAERSTADDAFDALQLRCHQLRAVVRGLLCEMREAGVTPSPETLSLSPDSFDP